MKFYPLRVQDIRSETPSSASITFDVPEAQKTEFEWMAGQHITLHFQINSKPVRRVYSISSSPGSSLRITVKKVPKGVISNYLCSKVKKGDTIQTSLPFGKFTLQPKSDNYCTYYFFAAGSGITPIYSMINSVLQTESHSHVYLLYGNQNVENIIFHKELEQLAEQYSSRFRVHHILSKPGYFSSYWRKGRIDKDSVISYIEQNWPQAQKTCYYICGPGEMNETVRDALASIDAPTQDIHFEDYQAKVKTKVANSCSAQVEVEASGKFYSFPNKENQTILEAAKGANISLPYSCESGVCGACKCRLIQGDVIMHNYSALDQKDLEQKYILTCQSVPKTSKLRIRIS